MKSQKQITIAACALFIMLGILSGGLARFKREERRPEEPVSETETFSKTEALSENVVDYTLKIQDGVLVVFSESDNIRPIIVTDIYASTLRHFDRDRLTEGITVSGELEMQKLLEDFSS